MWFINLGLHHKFLNGPAKAVDTTWLSDVWFRRVNWQPATISVDSFGLDIQLRALQAVLGTNFELAGFWKFVSLSSLLTPSFNLASSLTGSFSLAVCWGTALHELSTVPRWHSRRSLDPSESDHPSDSMVHRCWECLTISEVTAMFAF